MTSTRTPRQIAALDVDGVLIDYNAVFPDVWQKAFGLPLSRVSPDSYHATNEFGIRWESDTQKQHFYSKFDHEFWGAMPALPGALEACHQLAERGYELVCVTSMPTAFEAARWSNLKSLGFPISRMIATGRPADGALNPKLAALEALDPDFFADDWAHNFIGLAGATHKALIEPGCHDSPNLGLSPELSDSSHASLAAFTQWWLSPASRPSPVQRPHSRP